jgi:hypothetical protein
MEALIPRFDGSLNRAERGLGTVVGGKEPERYRRKLAAPVVAARFAPGRVVGVVPALQTHVQEQPGSGVAQLQPRCNHHGILRGVETHQLVIKVPNRSQPAHANAAARPVLVRADPSIHVTTSDRL